MGNGFPGASSEDVFPALADRPIGPPLEANGRQHGVKHIVVAAIVDHVLHHQHAQSVACVVEGFRLHFDVLAEQVEPQLLHAQDVPFVLLRVAGKIVPVSEISLVQHAI